MGMSTAEKAEDQITNQPSPGLPYTRKDPEKGFTQELFQFMAYIWTNKWAGKRIDVQTLLLQTQTGQPLALDMGKGPHESDREMAEAVGPTFGSAPASHARSRALLPEQTLTTDGAWKSV